MPALPPILSAMAQVPETSITQPTVPPALPPTPMAAYDCSLCEKSIVYHHVDHRTGVNEQYCSSCHQVWLEHDQELNRQSDLSLADGIVTEPPFSNEQQHAMDVNKELMASPPSAKDNSDCPSDAFSDLQQGVVMVQSSLLTTAHVDSNDPADVFSNSPSSVASPLSIINVDDLIDAFLDSAHGTSLIYSGSPESDSCSLASAFSDLPAHDPGSHHISINFHSPVHPTDENTTRHIDGNLDADDEQGSPYFGEHYFSSGFDHAPIMTAVDTSDSKSGPCITHTPQPPLILIPRTYFHQMGQILMMPSQTPAPSHSSCTMDSFSPISEEDLVLLDS